MPQKPEYSYVAQVLLNAYNTIARSRIYDEAIPRPLSSHDINAYLALNDLPVDLDTFTEVIYTLDNDYMKDECDEIARQRRINKPPIHKK